MPPQKGGEILQPGREMHLRGEKRSFRDPARMHFSQSRDYVTVASGLGVTGWRASLKQETAIAVTGERPACCILTPTMQRGRRGVQGQSIRSNPAGAAPLFFRGSAGRKAAEAFDGKEIWQIQKDQASLQHPPPPPTHLHCYLGSCSHVPTQTGAPPDVPRGTTPPHPTPSISIPPLFFFFWILSHREGSPSGKSRLNLISLEGRGGNPDVAKAESGGRARSDVQMRVAGKEVVRTPFPPPSSDQRRPRVGRPFSRVGWVEGREPELGRYLLLADLAAPPGPGCSPRWAGAGCVDGAGWGRGCSGSAGGSVRRGHELARGRQERRRASGGSGGGGGRFIPSTPRKPSPRNASASAPPPS